MVVLLRQAVGAAAGRDRRALPGIHPHLQAGAADERLLGDLAEVLRVGEGVVERELGLLADLGEAVEVEHAERLDRAGLHEGAVVDADQAGHGLAGHLGDQVERAGIVRRGLQDGAQGDAGHVLGEQQVALEGGGVDRAFDLGEAVEEAQHLHAGRADVAVQLDAGDAAFGDDEAQLAGDVEVGGDRAEHVAGGAVVLQDRLAGGVDPGQRHGGADEALGVAGDVGGREGSDAVHRYVGDAHRAVGHLAAGRRQGGQRGAGGGGRRRRRQGARDRRAGRHQVGVELRVGGGLRQRGQRGAGCGEKDERGAQAAGPGAGRVGGGAIGLGAIGEDAIWTKSCCPDLTGQSSSRPDLTRPSQRRPEPTWPEPTQKSRRVTPATRKLPAKEPGFPQGFTIPPLPV